MKTMKAAPAPNTPFLKVWHEGALSPMMGSRYSVWYMFLTEPARRHEAAMINVTLDHTCMGKQYHVLYVVAFELVRFELKKCFVILHESIKYKHVSCLKCCSVKHIFNTNTSATFSLDVQLN